MNVLVTGCAGFIGSHICDKLVAAGHTVTGMDDLSGGFIENVPKWVTSFRHASICNAGAVDRIFQEERIEAVIHCAAYAAEGLSHFIRKFNYENNVIGSINLINAAVKHKARVFVFLSSIAVYGKQMPPFDEMHETNPCDPYGIAKFTVEMDLRAANKMFALPYIIFRPFNVYGDRQNLSDPYRNVVGIFMNQCMKGEPMTIYGDGKQTRAFSYIDSVAIPIARSIDKPETWGQTYNIGGLEPYSVRELARTVASEFGVPERIDFLPPRFEAMHAYCNTVKARRSFGLGGSGMQLADGIKLMAIWAKERGPQEPTKFASLELTQGLPPNWKALIDRA